ncbi:hypothetical protein JTB14_034958 [Gonioctena quinquepunctata]|nr:hypothetical protein JTB14_034958 [Gonioctena quinquepunctata]
MKIYDNLPFEIIDQDEGDGKTTLYGEGMMVFVGPKKYCLHGAYKQHGLNIYNFQAREDDVYLIGVPRSGTTLHCEMVWLIGNDLDYESASKHLLDHRFSHIDYSLLRSELHDNEVSGKLESKFQLLTHLELDGRKGRRYLVSHLPLSLNPPSIFEVGAKVIYCARNPKDVIISLYRLISFITDVEFSFEEFFRLFMYNRVPFLPYFEHVKEAWARRNDKNFLFLFHEDTTKNERQTIIRVSEFLGKNLSGDELNTLEDHLEIGQFKKNKSINMSHLIENGQVGADIPFINEAKHKGQEEYFTGDLKKQVDEWIEENLKGTDLKFPDA